jgi:hypothetical protein
MGWPHRCLPRRHAAPKLTPARRAEAAGRSAAWFLQWSGAVVDEKYQAKFRSRRGRTHSGTYDVQPLCCVAAGAPGMPSAMPQSKRCDPARSEHAPIAVILHMNIWPRVNVHDRDGLVHLDNGTQVCLTLHIGVILKRNAIGVRSDSRMLLAFHFEADMANTLLRRSGTAMHGLNASVPGSSRIKGPFRCRNAHPCSRVRPYV